MTPDRINEHIDTKIVNQLSEGIKLSEIIIYLDDKIERFSNKAAFINVSRRYITNNWSLIDIKKRYTTYIVIQSYKRKKDIEWILSKKEEFKGINDRSLFKLIQLKERLNSKKNLNK
jgi:hypothetical protein